ncbi:HNH endonuclease [Streptomyces sp. NPDC096311]|uniref:HNH endonuclease n=1 Tax=Streptomyces sp. NPDC096311 TaxID=3366083 RepID=UPI00381E5C32
MYCGDRSQTVDHVIAFADGGADDLTNLVPVCHDCNRRKRDKTPPAWFIGMDLTIRHAGSGSRPGIGCTATPSRRTACRGYASRPNSGSPTRRRGAVRAWTRNSPAG